MKSIKKYYYFLPIIFSIFLSSIFFLKGGSSDKDNVPQKVERVSVHHREYKNLKPELSYSRIYSDPEFENLNMLGTVSKYGVYGDVGKVLRAMRFENISNAVENRYNLPHHMILAMVIEESNGVDLLPNGRNDGGFGLCHMQPATAHEFGLKIYADCKKMVCEEHALELKNILEKNNFDRSKVQKYDDRFNPILNLDAVGRMLASYMDGPKIKGLGPGRTAICRYAGKYNYSQYWADVRRNMNLLSDEEFMKKVEDAFNKANPNLVINGERGDFDSYIATSAEQAYNYGLGEYLKLPKYLPKNSEIVLATIDDF